MCEEIAVLEAVEKSERLLEEKEGVEEGNDKVEGVELVYFEASGWRLVEKYEGMMV